MNAAGPLPASAVRLQRRVLRFVGQLGLVPAGPLVVGVSGGPDSVCLLHVLAATANSLGTSLRAAHLNHGLRGAESDADQEYVVALCSRLGVPLVAEKVDLKSGRRRHSPLEEAAREARYAFFARAAADAGAPAVAVGHTRDDHLETVMLHLIRGTGTRGLRGLEPHSTWSAGPGSKVRVEVLRPLLEVRRAETADYCRALDLRPREDSSNLSPALLRNRVRLELLPLLRGFNPAIDDALARLARIARDDLAVVEAEAARLWPELARRVPSGIALDREKLASAPAGVRRALLRQALVALLGDTRDVGLRHVEALMELAGAPAGKQLSLPRSVSVAAGYGELLLGIGTPAGPPRLEGVYPLQVPGETRLPGWRATAGVHDAPALAGARADAGGLEGWFDLDLAGTELVVRGRCPGDRFQPLGMSAPKKLQDFMVDERIPRSRRDAVPLVCSAAGIIWVVGHRTDERFKASEHSRAVLRLRFAPV